jgi:hypothetical protein
MCMTYVLFDRHLRSAFLPSFLSGSGSLRELRQFVVIKIYFMVGLHYQPVRLFLWVGLGFTDSCAALR